MSICLAGEYWWLTFVYWFPARMMTTWLIVPNSIVVTLRFLSSAAHSRHGSSGGIWFHLISQSTKFWAFRFYYWSQTLSSQLQISAVIPWGSRVTLRWRRMLGFCTVSSDLWFTRLLFLRIFTCLEAGDDNRRFTQGTSEYCLFLSWQCSDPKVCLLLFSCIFQSPASLHWFGPSDTKSEQFLHWACQMTSLNSDTLSLSGNFFPFLSLNRPSKNLATQ